MAHSVWFCYELKLNKSLDLHRLYIIIYGADIGGCGVIKIISLFHDVEKNHTSLLIMVKIYNG